VNRTRLSGSKGVAGVLNSQHAGTGANLVNKYEDIVMPEQHPHLANKYKDIASL